MGDEEQEFKVEYLDVAEDAEPEVKNWLARPGKARVTYPDGCIYEGEFNGERIKKIFSNPSLNIDLNILIIITVSM